MKIQADPLCSACGEQEETSLHFWGECYANMQIRYSVFGAHLMQPSELHKVKPSTLLRFARATKGFSWPLVATGMCIGPNGSTASALSGWQLLAPKKRWKVNGHIKTAEQLTVIGRQQCGDWYIGRWWVGCYIWYSEEGPGRAGAPPSPLIAVWNV